MKILFVCHGNICRSPMAEFIMKKLVSDRGLEHEFEIASCATSTEEIGNSVYPPAKKILSAHGISCKGKTARKMVKEDYRYYDYIVGMDRFNFRNLTVFFDYDKDSKISLLMSHTNRPGDVDDPWYSGDFKTAFDDIYEGCLGLLDEIVKTYEKRD